MFSLTTLMHDESTRAVETMEQKFASLESEAIESGSIEGFSAVPDRFTHIVAPRLKMVIGAYLHLGPEPGTLEERARRITTRKGEFESLVDVYRVRYEGGAAHSSGLRGSWHRPITIALLGIAASLTLMAAHVKVSVVEFSLIAVITAAIALNHARIPAQMAHFRDYLLYLNAAHQVSRMARMLVKNHDRLEAELERRGWVERWVAEREAVLVGIYELHRGRGERAARLSASPYAEI